MMSWWVPQVVGTLVSTQKAQIQKVEIIRYGKVMVSLRFHAELSLMLSPLSHA